MHLAKFQKQSLRVSLARSRNLGVPAVSALRPVRNTAREGMLPQRSGLGLSKSALLSSSQFCRERLGSP